jgi:hypothetical protein
MPQDEYSGYQKDIIKRYYDNRPDIMLEKLGELAGELYLESNPAKQEKLWKRAEKAMENLGIKSGLVKHIMQQRDVEILAKNLKDWLAQNQKK